MALTDTAIRKLRPTDKPFKLGDSAGLYLLIKPNGSKLWYMKYRIDGKEKKLAFGPYPDVSLLNARQLRDAARRSLRQRSYFTDNTSFRCASSLVSIPQHLKSPGKSLSG